MRDRLKKWAWVSLLTLALTPLAAGCGTVGGKTYVKAYAEGDRAYSAGRFREAALAYQHAADVAERDRDREEALYAEAMSLVRAGDTKGALAMFDRLGAVRPPGERTYYAAFHAARIRIAEGDAEKGYAALRALFAEAPEVGVAHRSLRAVVLHVETTSGKAAALSYEASLYETFRETRLGEEILFDTSARRLDLGDASGALTGFLACADRYPYPTGALFDDALFAASQVHEQLGDAKAAVADLQRLLSVREGSDFSGSYVRPKMPAAQLRIGELQRDKLSDHPSAKKSFRAVYVDFPVSRLRAKALYAEAKLAHDDGDEATACSVAKKLVDEFAESRWARRADDACAAEKPRAEALRKAREERRKLGKKAEADND